jgi:hypothetical protein
VEPLFDRLGAVFGWIDLQSGKIVNRQGRHSAFVANGSVYDWRGRHVAWWHDDHIRNHSGQIALFLRDAGGFGPAKPALSAIPVRPAIAVTPARPVTSATPARPARSASWAPLIPFA